jgi:hypothetical protein
MKTTKNVNKKFLTVEISWKYDLFPGAEQRSSASRFLHSDFSFFVSFADNPGIDGFFQISQTPELVGEALWIFHYLGDIYYRVPRRLGRCCPRFVPRPWRTL